MAGAGYKLFQTGDVLTAAQVNTYLNEQTVMVFANAAARTSALTSVLAEGMVSYLQDTNNIEVYNGSAWVGFTGDITEVQAGTGISVASGTGPIPVITNTVATTFDAAGDLVYGTGADTFTKLSLGTAGKVLTVNSGATAPEWATPAAGGGMTLITSGNLGSGGVSLTSITGAYTDLYLYIYGVKFDTAGKYIGVWADGSSGSLRVTQLINTTAETSTYIRFGSSQQYLSGVMALGVLFKNYTNATGRKPIFYAGSSNDGTNDNELVGGGMANLTAAITRLDVENAVGGGNITAGSYELWGIK
jgi:hypothetical protein